MRRLKARFACFPADVLRQSGEAKKPVGASSALGRAAVSEGRLMKPLSTTVR